jgi:hypothetical protein
VFPNEKPKDQKLLTNEKDKNGFLLHPQSQNELNHYQMLYEGREMSAE